jgi:secondary thiamine-phosphate synthase enzyme
MEFDFKVTTGSREQMIDITSNVNDQLSRDGVRQGLCFVFIPHTTAGVTINEGADPDMASDMVRTLGQLIPRHGNYDHAEGNSDAHLKATIAGVCQTVPVRDGRLALGRWQSLYFCEFDGPRSRRVIVHVIPD